MFPETCGAGLRVTGSVVASGIGASGLRVKGVAVAGEGVARTGDVGTGVTGEVVCGTGAVGLCVENTTSIPMVASPSMADVESPSRTSMQDGIWETCSAHFSEEYKKNLFVSKHSRKLTAT